MDKFNAAQMKQIRDVFEDVVRPLEERMDRGFAALAEDFSNSRAELVEFKAKTSENFAAIEGQLKDIRQHLAPLRRTLGKIFEGYAE